MKKKTRVIPFLVLLLITAGQTLSVFANPVESPVQSINQINGMLFYQVTVPEGTEPLKVWKSPDLKNWTYLNDTHFGLNFIPIQQENQRGFLQYFSARANPNFPNVPEGDSPTLNIQESLHNPDATFFKVEKDQKSVKYIVLTGTFIAGPQNSPTFLEGFPIEMTTTGGSFDDLVDNARIELSNAEGSYFEVSENYQVTASENGTEMLLFDCDSDPDFLSGDVIDFSLILEFNPTQNSYEPGSTISARVMSSETKPENPFNIVLESDSGEVTANGFVQGNTHALVGEGLTAGSFSSEIRFDQQTGGSIFEITMEVSAFGGDFFVSVIPATSIGFSIRKGSTGEVVAGGTLASLTSSVLIENEHYRIDEGDSESLQISVLLDPDVSGAYYLTLESVTAVDSELNSSGALFDQQNYETEQVFILR